MVYKCESSVAGGMINQGIPVDTGIPRREVGRKHNKNPIVQTGKIVYAIGFLKAE